MLTYLSITNYALIESLQLGFGKGLNVLTGETGAGKSVIIGALKLLLGERADASLVRDPAAALIVEASFFSLEMSGLLKKTLQERMGVLLEDEEEIIVRREIQPDGKSRTFLNGRLVPLSQLREIGKFLVDLHGQHDHQLLFDEAEHLTFLDDYAGCHDLLSQYQKVFHVYQQARAQRDALVADESGKARELDLLTYQISELERANLEEGEEEKLEREEILLANAEKLHGLVQTVVYLLSEKEGAATQQLREATKRLAELARFDEAAAKFEDDLERASVLAEEAARDLERYLEGVKFDPDRLAAVQERLSHIESLKKKYGSTIVEMLAFLQKCRARHEQLQGNEQNLESRDKEIRNLEKTLQKMSADLSEVRRKAAEKMIKGVCRELQDLGMKDACMDVTMESVAFHARGSDRVRLLLSANLGESLKPLREIASGGEAARIMLAFKKVLAGIDRVGTLIFDEIDANIGGRLGKVVGEKMKQIASKRQVLVITHLPQIASYADRHFKVVKQQFQKRVVTNCFELNAKERLEEIAAMMSGDQVTRVSRKHAEEMLREITR